MRRTTVRLGAVIATLTVAAAAAAPAAQAITNGELDGTRHPNVGLFAIEHDGIKEAWCSGFYAGPSRTDPGTGVFVTAAHCLADLAAFGVTGTDLTATFDAAATYDEETFATTATPWHPAFAYDTSTVGDYGVILLEDPVAGLAGVELPRAHLLDDLADGGSLRPTTPFDNVGYGLIPRFKGGQPQYEVPSGRMAFTSSGAVVEGSTASSASASKRTSSRLPSWVTVYGVGGATSTAITWFPCGADACCSEGSTSSTRRAPGGGACSSW